MALGAAPINVKNGKPAVVKETKTINSGLIFKYSAMIRETGKVIEIQGTAEEAPFSFEEMQQMMDLGKHAIREIIDEQKRVLA